MGALHLLLQHLLPRRLVSRLVFHAARWTWGPWKNALIRVFAWKYGVVLDEAERDRPGDYASFNDFFTRALKDDVRPVDPDPRAVISPVDGSVSEAGEISEGTLVQAKGLSFDLARLLDVSPTEAARFSGGRFATLYLAPKDYHRVHLPVAGRLVRTDYMPGDRFSVNAATTARLRNLFVVNERAAYWFETEAGMMVVCMVGALCVGGIETVWSGMVSESSPGSREPDTFVAGHAFARGDEIARFNMGSTVILLFEPGRVDWEPGLKAGAPVRLGARIGNLKSI